MNTQILFPRGPREPRTGAFVRPRVPCVPCVSRLPPVSFYRERRTSLRSPPGFRWSCATQGFVSGFTVHVEHDRFQIPGGAKTHTLQTQIGYNSGVKTPDCRTHTMHDQVGSRTSFSHLTVLPHVRLEQDALFTFEKVGFRRIMSAFLIGPLEGAGRRAGHLVGHLVGHVVEGAGHVPGLTHKCVKAAREDLRRVHG